MVFIQKKIFIVAKIISAHPHKYYLNDQLSTCQSETQGLQETIQTTRQTLNEREQQLVVVTMKNQTMLSENNRLQSDLLAGNQNTKDSQQAALVSGEAWMGVPSTSNVILANADPLLGWIGKGALSLIIVGQGIVLWIKIKRPVRSTL